MPFSIMYRTNFPCHYELNAHFWLIRLSVNPTHSRTADLTLIRSCDPRHSWGWFRPLIRQMSHQVYPGGFNWPIHQFTGIRYGFDDAKKSCTGSRRNNVSAAPSAAN